MSASNVSFPKRIRVDGKEHQAYMLIERREPVYPAGAFAKGIEGTVTLDVVIGRDGKVLSVEPITGAALLAEAASEAVKAWIFRPTKLNGRPVEIAIQIEINF